MRKKVIWESDIAEKDSIILHQAVDDAIGVLNESIYRSLLENIEVCLFSEKENSMCEGEVVLSEEGEVQIFLCFWSMVNHWQGEKKLLEKQGVPPSLYYYAVFVLLHEVGHYVYGVLKGRGGTPGERLLEYTAREEMQREVMERGSMYSWEEVLQKYRKLPSEKEADDFAGSVIRRSLSLLS